MDTIVLKDRLTKKNDINILVSEVIDRSSMIPELLEIINTDKTSLRFSCTKIIRLVSEKKPELVYMYFDDISKLIYSTNSFIKWDGIRIISNLISVDSKGKFDLIYEEYFKLLNVPEMITSANVIGNAWKVVLHKPQYEKDITERLTKVRGITFFNKGKPSPECNRIACGHVIDCFDKYFSVSQNKEKILCFVRGQLLNSRKAVAKKAEKFLKKHGAEAAL